MFDLAWTSAQLGCAWYHSVNSGNSMEQKRFRTNTAPHVFEISSFGDNFLQHQCLLTCMELLPYDDLSISSDPESCSLVRVFRDLPPDFI
jgi:hypothetical protein